MRPSAAAALLLCVGCGPREGAAPVASPGASGSTSPAGRGSPPAVSPPADEPPHWLAAGGSVTCVGGPGEPRCRGFPQGGVVRAAMTPDGRPSVGDAGLCGLRAGGAACWSAAQGVVEALGPPGALAVVTAPDLTCVASPERLDCKRGALGRPWLGATELLGGAGARSLAVGASRACFVPPGGAARGAVSCAGPGLDGPQGKPTPVPGTEGAVEVVLGAADPPFGGFGCARLEAGGVVCWPTSTPPAAGWRKGPVAGLPAARALTAGAAHACALDDGGGVWCWGRGERLGAGVRSCPVVEDLGRGGRRDHCEPARVAGLGRVTAIAAGDRHTCALEASGAVHCWGDVRALGLGAAVALEPQPVSFRAP